MFCRNCGKEISDEAEFCSGCGIRLKDSGDTGSGQLVGFSSKINDPSFTKYKQKSTAWSFIFAVILAVIAIIAFPIYGRSSGDIEWPNSLYYGFGIGGMFIVIALLQTIKRGSDKTWDGVVVYKDSYRETRPSSDGHHTHHMVYVLKIKKDNGGKKNHKMRDLPGPFDYYNVGDRVRHHKGFYYYEKYDKSRDREIMCAACMTFNDISLDHCMRCHCPLLKQ